MFARLRLFASWTDFFEYLTFLSVCVAGVVHASWRWIFVGTLVLFLLGWPSWKHLIAKAGNVDAAFRELARMALVHRLFGVSFEMYRKAYLVPLVIGAKFLQDALFLTGAYVFGMAAGWFWDVDVLLR